MTVEQLLNLLNLLDLFCHYSGAEVFEMQKKVVETLTKKHPDWENHLFRLQNKNGVYMDEKRAFDHDMEMMDENMRKKPFDD
jgi:hypothetical protein